MRPKGGNRMVDYEKVKRFEKLSKTRQEMCILDRDSVAEMMRKNLASDIVNGNYGLNNVVRQMIMIEDYEDTTSYMRAAMK